MKPTRYNVGDRVVITDACIKRMLDSNRSCVTPQYPSQSFIDKAMGCKGIIGEVTHTFPPGYEVSAQFPVGEGAQAFHMKDHWIEPVAPTHEQIEALRKFAAKHGPAWRTILLHAWASGEDTRCEDGHLLRQVRNQFGPQGLKNIDLE